MFCYCNYALCTLVFPTLLGGGGGGDPSFPPPPQSLIMQTRNAVVKHTYYVLIRKIFVWS